MRLFALSVQSSFTSNSDLLHSLLLLVIRTMTKKLDVVTDRIGSDSLIML